MNIRYTNMGQSQYEFEFSAEPGVFSPQDVRGTVARRDGRWDAFTRVNGGRLSFMISGADTRQEAVERLVQAVHKE